MNHQFPGDCLDAASTLGLNQLLEMDVHYFPSTSRYTAAYCMATADAEYWRTFLKPAETISALNPASCIKRSSPKRMSSFLSGSTNNAPPPATSRIGERFEVSTGRPTACASRMGRPKPS